MKNIHNLVKLCSVCSKLSPINDQSWPPTEKYGLIYMLITPDIEMLHIVGLSSIVFQNDLKYLSVDDILPL